MSHVLDTLLGGGISYSSKNKKAKEPASRSHALVVPANKYEEVVSQLVLSAIEVALNRVLPIRTGLTATQGEGTSPKLVFLVPREVSLKLQHFSAITYKAETLTSGSIVATVTLGRYLTVQRRQLEAEEGIMEHVVVPIGSIAKVTWHGAILLPGAEDYGWRIVGDEPPSVSIINPGQAINLVADSDASCYITINPA